MLSSVSFGLQIVNMERTQADLLAEVTTWLCFVLLHRDFCSLSLLVSLLVCDQ